MGEASTGSGILAVPQSRELLEVGSDGKIAYYEDRPIGRGSNGVYVYVGEYRETSRKARPAAVKASRFSISATE